MSDGKLIVWALRRIGKAANAVDVPKILELVLPAGDDLVRVTLMPDVPEQLVLLKIEDVMC
jgi:hypothetical protein